MPTARRAVVNDGARGVLACESRFTGIFSASNALSVRAADPELALWAATLCPTPGVPGPVSIGGAAESLRGARLAAIGEGIERHRAHPWPEDEQVTASFADFPGADRRLAPDAWALFHAEQYDEPGFPFAPLGNDSVCHWCRFRDCFSGDSVWLPEDIAYLFPRPGTSHRHAPGTSTGLVAGVLGQPLLLRGAQECIERDAIVGAWWGRYPVEEWPEAHAFAALGAALVARLTRANLRYRFFRLLTPYSANVALVTLEGAERDGDVFSTGAACRETFAQALSKAALEAVQGRHFVRYLLATQACLRPGALPTTFAEHAVYYTSNPEQRGRTALARAHAAKPRSGDDPEGLSALRARLGPGRPILFRSMTPPTIAQTLPDWLVLKVVIPGLQPIHGDHRLPHLGGSLWGDAPIADYGRIPPHPMP
jgi:ribosomal protein S12 methylthiotransferase accessory factor